MAGSAGNAHPRPHGSTGSLQHPGIRWRRAGRPSELLPDPVHVQSQAADQYSRCHRESKPSRSGHQHSHAEGGRSSGATARLLQADARGAGRQQDRATGLQKIRFQQLRAGPCAGTGTVLGEKAAGLTVGERPPAKSRWLRVTAESRSFRLKALYSTLKSSSGSSGF